MARYRLNTPENARKTLAKPLREYGKDEIPSAKLRDLIYPINKLLDFFKLEKEMELEKRIERLETKLNAFNQRS
ncbi:MAG: hypothetical protein J7K04_06160 [Spirochaetales bacterium]|nr:hypothetical protein [Spirochaetales bacterium]